MRISFLLGFVPYSNHTDLENNLLELHGSSTVRNYFTYLWKNDQWKHKCNSTGKESDILTYAASDKFSSNGVKEGSTVFIVTVIEGELYLGGFIVVAQILNKSGAAKYLGIPEKDLWKAKEYIVAGKGNETLFECHNLVPSSISHKLEFVNGSGFVNPVVRQGMIDNQTFRNVRKLYPCSENLLINQLKP